VTLWQPVGHHDSRGGASLSVMMSPLCRSLPLRSSSEQGQDGVHLSRSSATAVLVALLLLDGHGRVLVDGVEGVDDVTGARGEEGEDSFTKGAAPESRTKDNYTLTLIAFALVTCINCFPKVKSYVIKMSSP
jgi:hypothetical protein